MLLRQDAVCQRLHGIAREHWDRGLCDDWSGVYFSSGNMDGAPRDLHAGLQSIFLRSWVHAAGKGGQ